MALALRRAGDEGLVRIGLDGMSDWMYHKVPAKDISSICGDRVCDEGRGRAEAYVEPIDCLVDCLLTLTLTLTTIARLVDRLAVDHELVSSSETRCKHVLPHSEDPGDEGVAQRTGAAGGGAGGGRGMAQGVGGDVGGMWVHSGGVHLARARVKVWDTRAACRAGGLIHGNVHAGHHWGPDPW